MIAHLDRRQAQPMHACVPLNAMPPPSSAPPPQCLPLARNICLRQTQTAFHLDPLPLSTPLWKTTKVGTSLMPFSWNTLSISGEPSSISLTPLTTSLCIGQTQARGGTSGRALPKAAVVPLTHRLIADVRVVLQVQLSRYCGAQSLVWSRLCIRASGAQLTEAPDLMHSHMQRVSTRTCRMLIRRARVAQDRRALQAVLTGMSV